ncbi:MAG TPA: TIGR04283 family arsenosugar biosynthesis glycosyltransferase [Thermoanaerobaculia bacterium]|jgi:rSAM/selenodomain-associated transferase 2|nr:TIGR04283 family arsenosugar biosynthesis glycosyltransferase [Thermoanaerobaculia bacterium]
MTARTSYPVSVIIPSLNEEARIGAAIASALAAGAEEVIVCDGGSSDRTLAVAEAHGGRVMACSPPRGRQLNEGAKAATGEYLIFLHADTTLPEQAGEAVTNSGADCGGFRLAFTEPALKLRIAAMMINLRTFFTRCPWGDQAQFIRRDRFLAMGGYREIAIMEDYEFARRMRRHSVILPQHVITSGRRFLEKGVWKTALINWQVVLRFRRGADPEELAKRYRS